MLCTYEDVIQFTGIKQRQMGLENDKEKFKEIIEKWILQCSDLIRSYCNNNFNDNPPEAVKNVALRLTANMIALYTARKDTPIVKVKDWSVQIFPSKIFSNDLKDDLKPFKIEKSTISDTIDFFAVTGEDIKW